MKAFLLCCLVVFMSAAGTASADPADPIRIRTDRYHDLGAAFKAVNDSLRGGDLKAGAIQQSATLIGKAATEQYEWFPAGSGPGPGTKTAAKPEIWSRPGDFRTAQDAFARQAEAFVRVAAGNDAAVIRKEARKLGATCKACHDSFREEGP